MRDKQRGRTTYVNGLWFLLVLPLIIEVVASVAYVGAQTTDWTWLIGKWAGGYKATTAKGKIYMTVSEVDANGKIAGTLYIEGGAEYHNRDLSITGSVSGLKGSETVYAQYGSVVRLELTRKGDELQGWGVGQRRSDVVMRKVE